MIHIYSLVNQKENRFNFCMSTSTTSGRPNTSLLLAIAVCCTSVISLAIAMGVGRFAFTPLFPLMIRDGLINSDLGALIAASNYLGYLVGALIATKIKINASALLSLGLLFTVVVTITMGWLTSFPGWLFLRFIAGVMSAWTLVATSAWGLSWFAAVGRPKLAGAMYSGVGIGIAAAGVFCLVLVTPQVSSLDLWIQLGIISGILMLFPLTAAWTLSKPGIENTTAPPSAEKLSPSRPTTGLIVCYTLFGFGYILPATYLPALAQQLVDDPKVFGLAWPFFGVAAALSTVLVSWGLKNNDRLRIWATSHVMMAVGVVIPVFWASIIGISIAALFVGGTFMVITMVGMQEARSRDPENATVILGKMTAGFAFGQLMGPLTSVAVNRFAADFTTSLNLALSISASGLLISAFFLWRDKHHNNATGDSK